MLCIYYTAKNPPWGSPTEDHQVLIQYIAGFIYSWKNLHLCCFVPAITQDFREKNTFIEWHSYYRFIQTNVNKNLWPVFPCLNRLVLNFIVKLNQQLKTFSIFSCKIACRKYIWNLLNCCLVQRGWLKWSPRGCITTEILLQQAHRRLWWE